MINKQLKWGVTALWVGVVASALAVVHVTHHCRTLYAQLAELERESNQLQVEWGQYLLEQGALASFSKIERLAKDKLDMSVPSPENIVVIRP